MASYIDPMANGADYMILEELVHLAVGESNGIGLPDKIFLLDAEGHYRGYTHLRDCVHYHDPSCYIGLKLTEVLPHPYSLQAYGQFREALRSQEKQYLIFPLTIQKKRYRVKVEFQPITPTRVAAFVWEV